jgi:hypothetical protein
MVAILSIGADGSGPHRRVTEFKSPVDFMVLVERIELPTFGLQTRAGNRKAEKNQTHTAYPSGS